MNYQIKSFTKSNLVKLTIYIYFKMLYVNHKNEGYDD